MVGGFWNSKKRARRVREETFNREGHWKRNFAARSDIWPIIETWANEFSYHLTEMKGSRRLYHKGEEKWFSGIYLDIRSQESDVILVSWIEVGLLFRILTLLFLPAELKIKPNGYLGILKRRQTCRDLNVLLERLHQPLIVGSDRFHIADLDPTSLFLGSLLPIPVIVFLSKILPDLDVRPGLTNILLSSVGTTLGLLLGVGLGVIIAHDRIIAKFLRRKLFKNVSVVVSFLRYSVVALGLLTKTNSQIQWNKLTYYCLSQFHHEHCRKSLGTFADKDKAELTNRIEHLKKELAKRN